MPTYLQLQLGSSNVLQSLKKVLKAPLDTDMSELPRHPQPLPGPLTTWGLWGPPGSSFPLGPPI